VALEDFLVCIFLDLLENKQDTKRLLKGKHGTKLERTGWGEKNLERTGDKIIRWSSELPVLENSCIKELVITQKVMR